MRSRQDVEAAPCMISSTSDARPSSAEIISSMRLSRSSACISDIRSNAPFEARSISGPGRNAMPQYGQYTKPRSVILPQVWQNDSCITASQQRRGELRQLAAFRLQEGHVTEDRLSLERVDEV